MYRLLRHENLLIRFLALYGLGLVIFLFAWALSYRFLPEGMLRGRSGAAALAVTSTHNLAILRSSSFFSLNSEPVEPRPDWRKNTNWIGLGLAVLVVFAASDWEAYRIVTMD